MTRPASLSMPGSKIDLRNLLNPAKFLPAYLERKDRDPLGLAPYSVEFHLTSTCNYNCCHCSYGTRNRAGTFVRPKRIELLLEDLTGPLRPRGVYFSGGGEPTTLKGWDGYIQRLADSGVRTALVTNASLLGQRHLPALARLDYLAVSIYSPNQETYKKITGGDRFAAQFEIPAMVKAVAPKVTVGARNVINPHNHAQVPDIYRLAMQAGYDYVIFIPEIDYEKRGLALSAQEVETLLDICPRADADPAKTNLTGLVANRFGYYRDFQDICGQIDCLAARLRTNAFVNYDGGVYLCQPLIGNQDYCVGNINEKRLAEIWNSKRHQAVVEALSGRWRAGQCENCRSGSHNRAALEYQKAPENTPLTVLKDSFL